METKQTEGNKRQSQTGISVVIPHYNDLQALRVCVFRVLQQGPHEVIIVDDGSNMPSLETEIPFDDDRVTAKTLMAQARPTVLYLVDPWVTGGPKGSLWDQTAQQEALEAYCSQVAYWALHESQRNGDAIKVIRQASPEASLRIPGQVDWVYIDGDHRYQSVMDDLIAWWPKIRVGGVMWGDDWSDRGWYGTQVQDAVRAFFGRRSSYLIEIHGKPGYQQWRVQETAEDETNGTR